MVRNDHQIARACRALLAKVRLERLWTSSGPTARARELLVTSGGSLSNGERIVLFAAWALWNGDETLTLKEVIGHLDAERCEELFSLILARKYGADTMDDWLDEHEPKVSLHVVEPPKNER